MRYAIAIVFLLTCAFRVVAQVIELHGGASTLFESKGGEIDFKGNNYGATFGAGTIGPRLLGGASVSRKFAGSSLTLGAQQIAFNLPTDIFDTGHYLTAVGGSVRTTLPDASILLFGGMMSQDFEGTFFHGVRGVQPAGVLLFDGRVSRGVAVTSRLILSRQITMIEGISWRPTAWAQMAASGGVGSGKAYGAASAKVNFSIFDLKAAYIQASPGFRRAEVDTIVTSEPDRLNALLTVTPDRRFSMTVGHSQYLTPTTGPEADARSSVDEVEAVAQLSGTALSASVFRSVYQGGSNQAYAVSVGRTLGPRLRAQGSYLHSAPSQGPATASAVGDFTEVLSPRWTVSQILNTSNGQTTAGFGTSFLSNRGTFSADYETYYIPAHLPNPFEEALILNADLNLFGRGGIQGGTFVAPDGSVKHTVSANGTFARDGSAAPANDRNPVERYVLVGRVVDRMNQPVEGAALTIDHIAVYTDSDGDFVLHERQQRFHILQVQGKQFLDGGEYIVVSGVHNIRSTLPDDAVATVIVVQRIGNVCAREGPCKA